MDHRGAQTTPLGRGRGVCQRLYRLETDIGYFVTLEHLVHTLTSLQLRAGPRWFDSGMSWRISYAFRRETFVELYKTNLLEEFRAQIAEQLPEALAAELPPTPPQGCLDIGDVLKAKLAFS